jgi:hypothetical protein
MKSSILALSALTVSVLAACGGGGGGDSSSTETAAQVQADPALTKYVGTWEACKTYTQGTALFRARVLSVQGDTATVEMDLLDYAGASCAGAPRTDLTVRGTAKMAGGTKVLPARDSGTGIAPARTFEKVVFTYSGFTLRAGILEYSPPMANTTRNSLIALGADGKAHFGLATLDADGYPASQSTMALTKRP